MSIKLVEDYPPVMADRRPVVGYEGLYEISEEGVWSIKAGRWLAGSWRGGTSGDRYFGFNLYRNGKCENKSFHVLLLEAFVGPRPPGMNGLHKDDDSRHNSIDNLYWGTQSENCFDAVRNGVHSRTRRDSCPRGHSLATPNLVLSRLEKYGQRTCLSCRQATNVLRYRPSLDLKEVSDAFYEELINNAHNPFRRTISQGLRESRRYCVN